MAKVIMVQGTMSNVGKSLIVAGLCRILHRDGWRVCPFKSQNMALNSYITEDGLEMGRAQVMQAEAAGVKPSVSMNPILLKPVTDMGSQVIVNGRVVGNMPARDYFAYKKQLIPEIMKAFRQLEEKADIIVIEGAGSPAEINLKENDIVNMGLAAMVNAPVLLVGDIDRGGVFAQLLGTLMLLNEEERKRVKGLVINKFRGDVSILDPGVEMLEERGKVPVVGVVPYMKLQIEDEDSLAERLANATDIYPQGVGVSIAVIRFPRLSNFTDFDVFAAMDNTTVYYVTSTAALGDPDLVILPGSKNTIEDLLWMRSCGLEAAIKKLATEGIPVMGICGGFQILGMKISDPEEMESGGEISGMGLLPVETSLSADKTRVQAEGNLPKWEGIFGVLSGMHYKGYEIHMGRTWIVDERTGEESLNRPDGIDKISEGKDRPVEAGEESMDKSRLMNLICEDKDNFGKTVAKRISGAEYSCVTFAAREHVYGTYIHGLFDEKGIAAAVTEQLAKKKGIILENTGFDYAAFRQKQYDLLAEELRRHLNMGQIYEMMGITSAAVQGS